MQTLMPARPLQGLLVTPGVGGWSLLSLGRAKAFSTTPGLWAALSNDERKPEGARIDAEDVEQR